MDLIHLRNADFLEKCETIIRNQPLSKPICLREVAVEASQQQPRLHHLSFDYALRAIRHHRRHRRSPLTSTTARQRLEELSEQVAARQERQGITDSEALQQELAEGRPSSFFLTPEYAVRLLERLRK